MDVRDKIESMARAARHDLACACGSAGDAGRLRGAGGEWIHPAALPGGRTVPLLKVLQSGACERDCAYCAQRSGGPGRAADLSPDELAGAFDDLVRAGRVQGLFLSSAIRGSSERAMDAMLATVEIVRRRHGFRGFVHLKILPGAGADQIDRAAELADRVSVNLEAPTPGDLGSIAPRKDLAGEILPAMDRIRAAIARPGTRCRSHTTQFVVGAGEDRDREILSTLWTCYEDKDLARGYFSAFQPVPGTPLEDRPPGSRDREHRLYQADFLFRRYGFSFGDLFFGESGDLPLCEDPKAVWARRHPEVFPVEINTAPRGVLLRVPGIGPGTADAILRIRRGERIRDLDALRSVTRRWRVASRHLLLDGRLCAPREDRQLSLLG